MHENVQLMTFRQSPDSGWNCRFKSCHRYLLSKLLTSNFCRPKLPGGNLFDSASQGAVRVVVVIAPTRPQRPVLVALTELRRVRDADGQIEHSVAQVGGDGLAALDERDEGAGGDCCVGHKPILLTRFG
jgi:hypothetical protein